MTQPKIDTSTGFLKIDCLNFDIMSGHDSDNSPCMAPVVHDRSAMITFFQMPTKANELVQDQKLSCEFKFQPASQKKFSSAISEGLAPLEVLG